MAVPVIQDVWTVQCYAKATVTVANVYSLVKYSYFLVETKTKERVQCCPSVTKQGLEGELCDLQLRLSFLFCLSSLSLV